MGLVPMGFQTCKWPDCVARVSNNRGTLQLRRFQCQQNDLIFVPGEVRENSLRPPQWSRKCPSETDASTFLITVDALKSREVSARIPCNAPCTSPGANRRAR